jgi:ribosomal-protein-alanine N-acetyltransferase
VRLERAGVDALDELAAVEARAAQRPWPREVFAEELERSFSHVMVLRDERILAFIVYWIVGDELQVLNLATDPNARRQGHAARLVEHAVAAARRGGCARLLLEVRRSNAPALRLYRKYGFRPIGVRAEYYSAEREDAIVMRLTL